LNVEFAFVFQIRMKVVKLSSLMGRLRGSPLIASVQASPKSAVDNPDTLLRLARASVQEGVSMIRLDGVKNIKAIKGEGGVPIIGLLKRSYPGSDVYITPASQDVDALLDLGCEVIALDATARERPFNATVAGLIQRVHRRNVLVMADCDTLENAIAAAEAGADLVGTTLAGYTPERAPTEGPDFELLRQICKAVTVPVIAEGRYTQRWQVETALRIGASAVVVGGALNDPVKQTRALMPLGLHVEGPIGAVDIGGTWLRFATFGSDWTLQEIKKAPNPPLRDARIAWIRERIAESGVTRVGLGTGGVTDPRTGEVWTAKEYLMPDQIGILFDKKTLGIRVFAHGDGHASAWGHANLPQFAGKRVATLAIGTGVGCGFVQEGKIWSGPRGEYPRVNDLSAPTGQTYEALLGGLHLTADPTEEQQESAKAALRSAVDALRGLYFPDEIVVCGGVGLADWLQEEVLELSLVPSPFGHDAGLFGAAALALFPDYL
jgi:putative N-acetylmannosamine-6-phosphate epimerase